MGKKDKRVSRGTQQRERLNPLTGQIEVVPGTKAGKRRTRLPFGHPLRTHDLHFVSKAKKVNETDNRDD